jgi:predicted transcriptional regulator
MTLSIRLPEEAERRLQEAAKRLNVPVADLAAAALQDFVTGPTDEFDDVARRVLEKNKELYRRLA